MKIHPSTFLTFLLLVGAVLCQIGNDSFSNADLPYQIKAAMNRGIFLLNSKIIDLQKNVEVQNEKLLNLSETMENTLRILAGPRDCAETKLHKTNTSSGHYLITLLTREVEVFCKMDGEDNWTIIQKRVGPSRLNETRQDFYLNWKDYEDGFGNVNDEYWIGLKNMAALTVAGDSELRIELTDWEDNTTYAAYGSFKVGDFSTGYKLFIDNYSGTAGDSLAYHNNMEFSTKDKDQDGDGKRNCAEQRKGAWWYNGCSSSNLNGLHASFGSNGIISVSQTGIYWLYWKGIGYSFKKVTMMTRRKL